MTRRHPRAGHGDALARFSLLFLFLSLMLTPTHGLAEFRTKYYYYYYYYNYYLLYCVMGARF